MKDLRTGALLGTACLLAGIGPFVLPGREAQYFGAAAAFCLPLAAALLIKDRAVALAVVAVAIGLIAFGSIGGVFVMNTVAVRRVLLVRNLQMAAAGAACATLVSGILWAFEVLREERV